ncbi:allophanate hydrolase [Conexibacter stalactiti]|uniref:Allophanate hydrolase n=1 Tax=Conexibacter stalactiti TaxID=1940611 RepID=A0ABU4HSR4_9ACTN|nr:allophanate hydrolase [Conexibacter stalactiti]MDW5596336.1 allophanate hydrolase [Conexibacter stalactiti]MEC5036978.1 allophanate hydrolase [Conexibacter stalactiti]
MADGTIDLTAVALAARERAAAPDQAGAWIALADEAQLRARAVELAAADPAELPLLGMTFGVKDNIDVEGWPTTAACPAFARVASRTAPAVQLLLDAGAILIGKTNLDQFATGLVGTRSPYGTPRNVLDPTLVPGGSSSGSAIAVAGGAVDIALGTDTAGSGRVPAALNGIVGLKPSRGLVSTGGVVPACRSLDCVSIFARDVRDAARVLDVIAAFDPEDPFSREAPSVVASPAPNLGVAAPAASPAMPRVGVPALSPADFAGDALARDAFAAACEQLAARGAEVVAVDAAPLMRAGELLYGGPWVAERAAAVGTFIREHLDEVLPVTRELIVRGFEPSAVAAFEAQYELEALRAATRALFARERLDAIALPTIPTLVTVAEDAAEPLARNALLGRFTHNANLLDLAALALPGPLRADGGPASAMLLGPAFSDRALLAIGARFTGEEVAAAASDALAATAPGSGAAPTDEIELLVVGAHMSGMPLEPQLRGLGGRPLDPVTTDTGYRMLALSHLAPPRPGLVADPAGAGGLAGELWALPPAGLGRLLTLLAFPLSLGPVRLADGRLVTGFLCSPDVLPDAPDITAHGGWRAYTAATAGETVASG